jgi:hypothetical protein
MRKLLAGVTLLLFTGCSTLGLQPSTVTRIVADSGCVGSLLAAGLQIAGDPILGGAVTAYGVVQALVGFGSGGVPATIMAACQSTLGYAAQDVAGIKAMFKPAAGGRPVAAAHVIPVYSRAHPPAQGVQPPVPTKVQVAR